jgi:hypothetical protein
MMVEAIRSGEPGVVREHERQRQQNAGTQTQIASQADVLIGKFPSRIPVLVEPEPAETDDQQRESTLATEHRRDGADQRRRDCTENAHRPPGHLPRERQAPVHAANKRQYGSSIPDRYALGQLSLRKLREQADTQEAQRKGRNARVAGDLRGGGQASYWEVSMDAGDDTRLAMTGAWHHLTASEDHRTLRSE